MSQPLLTRFLQPLLAGRRSECFQLVTEALQDGWAAEDIIKKVVWPSLAQIDRLYRDDRINIAVEHMAVRINRTIADQMQVHLKRSAPTGKRVIIACAEGEPEELGAQMVADLFQSGGWDSFFLGGGVPNDEILSLIGQLRPHTFIIFGTRPEGVPETRKLVELIRGVGVGQTMNIIVSGGIYGRVEGLWQEVGADIVADTAEDALQIAAAIGPREPRPMSLGVVKKRRRRRKDSPELVPA